VKLLATAREAAGILAVDVSKVYELAAAGVLERRYIGKRNFRIPYASLQAYVDSLPTEPVDT